MYQIDMNELDLSIVPVAFRDKIKNDLHKIHSLTQNESWSEEISEIINYNSDIDDRNNYFLLVIILNSEMKKFEKCEGSVINLKFMLEDFRESYVLFCDGGEFLYDVTTMLDHGDDAEFQATVHDIMYRFSEVALKAALSNIIGQKLQ